MLEDGSGRFFADFARRVLFLPAFWAKLPPDRAAALHSSFLRLLLTSAEASQYLACLTAGPWAQSERFGEHRGEVASVLSACAQREPEWAFRESVYTAMSASVVGGRSLRFTEWGCGAVLTGRAMVGFLASGWEDELARDGAEHRAGALALCVLDRLGGGAGESVGQTGRIERRSDRDCGCCDGRPG